MTISAAILAGGKGSRMRGFSDTPKVLLPLGGKSLLARQLDWLAAAGARKVHLLLGHQADEVKGALGDGSRWGLELDFRVEKTPRGTAGAVLDLAPSGDLLIVYGDLVVEMDAQRLLRFHAEKGACATVVVRNTDHPEDSDLVEMEGHYLTRVGRAAGGLKGNLGCAAVWVVTPELLSLVPKSGLCDFARDVFPAALKAGKRLAGYLTDETVADVGTPERYEAYRKRLS